MVGVEHSDTEMAIFAMEGEIEAVARLLERYRPSLYASAIRLLHNREDALDAVQDTFIVAVVRLPSLRDPAAVAGWLHTVLRNNCLMRLRRARRAIAPGDGDLPAVAAGPEEMLEHHALREWLWTALAGLSSDDRLAVMLRYFTRSASDRAIAAVCDVPVGTVRSRLNRARSQLGCALRRTFEASDRSHAGLERTRREEWEQFYAELHRAPVPRTYRDAYAPDVDVTDGIGRWKGLGLWCAHEREAIQLGVRATIVGLVASRDITILEINFTNPIGAADHCPPRSTFVHRLAAGRSQRLDIHYV